MSNNLKNCEACDKGIVKGARKFKTMAAMLLLFVVVSMITACGGGDKQTPTDTSDSTKTKANVYSNGTYIVNKDIQSGLYRVTLTDTLTKVGYIQRAKNVDMKLSSIIADISLTGNGYVEILKTDAAVKLKGVEIEPIKIEDLKPSIKTEATGGVYLIGYDLAPGTYEVQITDIATNSGYMQRLKSVAMGSGDIISKEIISKSGTVKIEKGDFAVLLQGVKITLQK